MTTLCTNAKNKATGQFTNFDYNSMTKIGDSFVGFSDSGLHRICCGTSDDSTEISASFTVAMTDFGISNPKRMAFLYIGYEADGDLQVVVYCDEALVGTYDIPAGTSLQQRHMVKLGEGAYGRYWQFKFQNVDGADFSIDSAEVVLHEISHTHG